MNIKQFTFAVIVISIVAGLPFLFVDKQWQLSFAIAYIAIVLIVLLIYGLCAVYNWLGER